MCLFIQVENNVRTVNGEKLSQKAHASLVSRQTL